MLTTRNLTHSFGKFGVIKNVNLTVGKKEIRAIIGPNGAGKTTLFNLITGTLIPQKGEILFNDQIITHTPILKRIRLGISRSFQIPNLLPGLTVFDNVRIAVLSLSRKNMNLFARADHMSQVEEKVNTILSEVGLEGKKEVPVKSLSHGDKRLLEIGLALGTDPKILLLDEPTAGVSEQETKGIIQLIKSLSAKYTIIFIEHDMEMVMSVAEKITVLHQGSILAEGHPAEIKKNQDVQTVYLGGLQ
jgi:ABC-type branched-subunit amino acid transport system ATPase component